MGVGVTNTKPDEENTGEQLVMRLCDNLECDTVYYCKLFYLHFGGIFSSF